jgi:1-acyl-sn-glycerol-3-phosphate acyltransferase
MDADRLRSLDYSRWAFRQRLFRRLCIALARPMMRIRVEGLEHLPATGAVIVAGNHLSLLDAPIGFLFVHRRAVLLATDELRVWPWLRWVLESIGDTVFVERDRPARDVLALARAVLEGGGMLVMAPEGTRSRDRSLQRGHSGVAYLATRTGTPVVPAAVWGQERLVASWRRLRRPQVALRFGPALHLEQGNVAGRGLRAETDRIMLAVARMLPPAYRGVYADAAREANGTTAEPATPA